MAFHGYEGDLDMYRWTPYGNTTITTTDYDFASTPFQTSSQYSFPYEFVEPELVDYNSSASVTPLELNYSVCTYSEPETLQYKPTQYRSSHNYHKYSVNFYSEPKLLQYELPSDQAKFTISYSTAEFNEPEFEEYDPTPYGGGYDPVATYGKPLPPSDITCYPRSVPKPDSTSLEDFSYASIPSPYGKDDDIPIKPPNGSKPGDTEAQNVENNPPNGSKPGDTEAQNVENNPPNGSKPVDIKANSVENKPPNGSKPVDVKANSVENGDRITSDGGPDVEIADERGNEFENGTRGDFGYEIGDYRYAGEGEGLQIPYGSGLEAMDLCESLFGYWPCLAKRAREQRIECLEFADQERRMDPCKGVADYLFGNPLVYDYEYHHHHQEQAE